jgi:hypothetical protein
MGKNEFSQARENVAYGVEAKIVAFVSAQQAFMP